MSIVVKIKALKKRRFGPTLNAGDARARRIVPGVDDPRNV